MPLKRKKTRDLAADISAGEKESLGKLRLFFLRKEVDIFVKKRGRPLKEDHKGFRCEIRMTEEEHDILDYLVEKKDMSKTELVNKALKMLYNLEKYRE